MLIIHNFFLSITLTSIIVFFLCYVMLFLILLLSVYYLSIIIICLLFLFVCIHSSYYFLYVTSSGGYSNLGARGKNFQKFMLSEKKKRSDLGLDIFLPKSKCSLKKKKKKGLHSESSTERIQNCICCFRGGALKIEGGPQKKGGPEATASFSLPNIHHWSPDTFRKGFRTW